MRGERWLERWRSRGVLIWTAVLFVVFLGSALLSAKGQCEHWSFDDGSSIPINYPWQPDTTAGRVLVMRLISAMAITEHYSGALVLIGLVGLLWARVLRFAALQSMLVLVPVLALLLQLPELAVFLLNPEYEAEPPLSMQLAWEAEFWSRPFTKASLLLVGVGLVALGLRVLLARKLRSSRA
jgi:hypothetical protein